MREGWVETTAGDIAFVNPETAKPTENSQRFRYVDLASVSASMGIDIANLEEYTFDSAPGRARRIIREGDVLISTVRPYLRGFAIVPPELDSNIASTGFTVLRADDSRTISDFVWAITRTKEFVDFLMDRATGSNYPAVRPKDISDFPIALPPLAEQRRIVDVIESVDNYITALETRAETARTASSALLHELLSKPGPDWVETTLGEIAESGFLTDGDWVESKDQDPNGEHRLLQLADIGVSRFLDKSDRWMNSEQFHRLRCTPLQPDDILIARMPDPIARACLVPSGLPACATVVDVAILRCSGQWNPNFLVLMFNDSIFRTTAESRMTGTTRKRISRSNLSAISLRVPPSELQQRVLDLADSFDSVIQAAENAASNARIARSALLSDLLTGNHEIPASYDQLLGAA
jgi:type I restriction enzyme S subunit